MKKFLLAVLLVLCVTGLAFAGVKTKVGLITMDQMDVHWVRLQKAAQARVDELNKQGNKLYNYYWWYIRYTWF